MIETDPFDDALDALPEARNDETAVAAGRIPGNAFGFDDRDRPSLERHFTRDREAGEASAHHANVDVEIQGEARPFRRSDHGRRIPARPIFLRMPREHVPRCRISCRHVRCCQIRYCHVRYPTRYPRSLDPMLDFLSHKIDLVVHAPLDAASTR